MGLWEVEVLLVRDFVTLKEMHFYLLRLRHSYSEGEGGYNSVKATVLPSQGTDLLPVTGFVIDYIRNPISRPASRSNLRWLWNVFVTTIA